MTLLAKNCSPELSLELKKAIEIRLKSSKSSVKKFDAFLEATSPDGRARNQFVYYGAHTGRWSGRAVQPHNLKRVPPDSATYAALLAAQTVESLEKLSTCLRPCIRAGAGKTLVVADLSTIEVRALAWLSGCDSLLSVFNQGLDPYIAFGTGLYAKEYSAITKEERQICKPAVLACGFGQGGGQLGPNGRTGLWGYAQKMGVELAQSQSHDMVYFYRSEYGEVVEFWGYCEDAFAAAVSNWKEPSIVGYLKFIGTADGVKIELPSGRCLHYHRAKVDAEGNLSFWGARSHDWGPQSTWGGKLTENIVQAVGRDVLAEAMLRADAVGLPLIGHVHDEPWCEVREDRRDVALAKLIQCLTTPISWAPGLPLAAEGYVSKFYTKG